MSIESKIAKVASLGITCIKNADNPYYNSKYADLSTVVEALKQPLAKEKLGYMFSIDFVANDDNATPSCWLVKLFVIDLENGDKTYPLMFPVPSTEPQKFGSSVTYAKRYLLTTAFNVIAEEDDDGNATVDKVQKKQPQPLAAKNKFFN